MREESLQVVVRYSPGSNDKSRPDWFSKEVCIQSVLDSVDRHRARGGQVETVLAVDTSSGMDDECVPAGIRDRFDATWKLVGGSAARSWRAVLRLSMSRTGADLVYFVEDDHLHQVDAVERLLSGEADYRFLYASDADLDLPADHDLAGWITVGSGVTSFAVRRQVMNRDRWVHMLFSFAGRGWDEVTFRALGGGARHLLGTGAGYVSAALRKGDGTGRRVTLGAVRHAAFRAASQLLSGSRSRKIEALVPSAATHAETGLESSGTDWGKVASDVRSRWGASG